MENKPRKSSTAYIAICVKYACKNVLSSLDIDALEIIILGGGPVDTRNLNAQNISIASTTYDCRKKKLQEDPSLKYIISIILKPEERAQDLRSAS